MKTLTVALSLSFAIPVLACDDPRMHGGRQFGQDMSRSELFAERALRFAERRDYSNRIVDTNLDKPVPNSDKPVPLVEAPHAKAEEPRVADNRKGTR